MSPYRGILKFVGKLNATRKSQDRCFFTWWSLKKTLEVMVGSYTDMSRQWGCPSCDQSPCWTSFIQFLHLKKKDTSYHFHEAFGVSTGSIILYFQYKWDPEQYKKCLFTVERLQRGLSCKNGYNKKALFLLIHVNTKCARNRNYYSICKFSGI